MGDMADYYDQRVEFSDEELGVPSRLCSTVADMVKRFDTAKAARTGSFIACPTCCRTHTKITYHKIFCSNDKTAGAGNCKDRYHNTVDSTRRARAIAQRGFR